MLQRYFTGCNLSRQLSDRSRRSGQIEPIGAEKKRRRFGQATLTFRAGRVRFSLTRCRQTQYAQTHRDVRRR